MPWLGILATLLAQLALLQLQQRRLRQTREEREALARLVVFAAWMSTEASGAPKPIREMAKAALPPGAEVSVDFIPPTGKAVH